MLCFVHATAPSSSVHHQPTLTAQNECAVCDSLCRHTQLGKKCSAQLLDSHVLSHYRSLLKQSNSNLSSSPALHSSCCRESYSRRSSSSRPCIPLMMMYLPVLSHCWRDSVTNTGQQ